MYIKHVRSEVEFASVVWNSSLTQECINTIERVQKSAFAVILASRCQSYDEACAILAMARLSKRRETLSIKFATKSILHPIHRHWFVENQWDPRTRSIPSKYKPVQGKTQRLLNSAIPKKRKEKKVTRDPH